MQPAFPVSIVPSSSAPRGSAQRGSRNSPPRRQAPALPPQDSLAYAMLQAAQLVAGVLEGANLTDAYEKLLKAQPGWSDATRGAVRDLAWSTLRDYGRGDAVLSQLVPRLPPPFIHGLLLVALCRLAQRPEQAHTVVDQAVSAAAALMPGLKGMVNGVLRNVLRQTDAVRGWQAEDEESRYAHPRWWIAEVRAAHPQDWEAVLAAGCSHPPMSLRINRRRAEAQAEAARLAAAGLPGRLLAHGALLLERPVAVGRLPGYAEGRLSVQDAGAQWAARLLAPRAGERVLDACAAPGGKTAHLLESADIDLLALELDPQRAAGIQSNLERLGLRARVKTADCRDVDGWWDGRPFDRILADVPCSASGVVRRHPDIKWLRRKEDIATFAEQQAAILDALWRTLAPGGTMLYVTCSVFDAENGAQVERFLARHMDAERLPIDGRPAFQLLPNAEHDGFYYALLRKSA